MPTSLPVVRGTAQGRAVLSFNVGPIGDDHRRRTDDGDPSTAAHCTYLGGADADGGAAPAQAYLLASCSFGDAGAGAPRYTASRFRLQLDDSDGATTEVRLEIDDVTCGAVDAGTDAATCTALFLVWMPITMRHRRRRRKNAAHTARTDIDALLPHRWTPPIAVS